jgi:hypothetical protein
MLGGLFGGPDGDRVRSQARDFVSRYEQGAPHEGYTRDEVLERFQTARGAVGDDDMRDAARQAFQRMSPDQRREYKRAMRQRGVQGFERDDDGDDPEILAQATQRFMKESPQQEQGGLGGLFGGLFGGGQSEQRPAPQQQNNDDFLDNPAVKAAMAGMAAFAMKKVLDNR